jgi:hypothetical protein
MSPVPVMVKVPVEELKDQVIPFRFPSPPQLPLLAAETLNAGKDPSKNENARKNAITFLITLFSSFFLV